MAQTAFTAVLLVAALLAAATVMSRAPVSVGPLTVAGAQTARAGKLTALRDPRYPLAGKLDRFLNQGRRPARGTGITRDDYLQLVRGVVKFFRAHQNAEGAIIDPYEKKERQYATPAFACAAAALVQSGAAPELREPAERAFRWAAEALSQGRAADNHGDFYTVLLMHAGEMLRAGRHERGAREAAAVELPPFDPLKVYRDIKTNPHNWNVVALSGEFLRYRAGLTPSEAFVETSLEKQLGYFNEFGMYRDPNDPLAYDLFPRLWLTDMVAHGYAGAFHDRLAEQLERGAATSLFMQSPLGLLPAGGRSGGHQWNEAEQAATFEIMAHRFARSDPRLAGAFKRAAHLSLRSMKRWVRPSGELWIVKNRFDPGERYGYERYSFHSQYNLLAAAMLAIAWQHADERVSEWATPAETGGFVFQVRTGFDKLFANAGGTFLEYDLNADLHYNPTGIIRVHFPGQAVLNDGAVARPGYETGRRPPTVNLAMGTVWDKSALADRVRGNGDPAEVRIVREQPAAIEFQVTYANGGCPVSETIRVEARAVRVKSAVACAQTTGANVPFLTDDGQRQFEKAPTVIALTPGATARRLKLAATSRWGLLDALRVEAPGKEVAFEVRRGNRE